MDHLRDFLTFAGQSPTVYHAVPKGFMSCGKPTRG